MIPEEVVYCLFNLSDGPLWEMGRRGRIPKCGGKKTVNDKSFPFIAQISVAPSVDDGFHCLYSRFKVITGAVHISKDMPQDFIGNVVIVPVEIVDAIRAMFK